MSTATVSSATAAVPTTGPESTLRRTGLVVGLVLAPWCWVVADTTYLLAIRGGGSDATGAETLALNAAHPTLLHLSTLAVVVGGLLVVPAGMGLLRLAPRARLVTVGASMMVAGYIAYAIAAGTTIPDAMAATGATARDAAVLDRAASDPWSVWLFVLFVAGNLLGTLVTAAGLWRARVVPVAAPLLIACWPVLHVIGLVFFGNEVPQVVGAVLQAVGFAICARALVRAPRAAG